MEGKLLRGIYQDNLCLAHWCLIAFSEEMIDSVEKGRALDVGQLDFRKAFSMVYMVPKW